MNKIARFDLSKKLKSRRREIDLIDQKLLSLLNQRLHIALEIGKIKKQMGTKTYDPKREKEILERLRLRLRSRKKALLEEKDLEKIFRTIISVCRRGQKVVNPEVPL
jgi:chorismate mutase/prephenate dehydratase